MVKLDLQECAEDRNLEEWIAKVKDASTTSGQAVTVALINKVLEGSGLSTGTHNAKGPKVKQLLEHYNENPL